MGACSREHFIKNYYKSRFEGCVTSMLEDLKLPTLQQRRLESRLVMLYKVVRGTVPASNADEFLIPLRNKRNVKPRVQTDFQTTNFVQRYSVNHTNHIWHPYHETQIGQVEKVQRTAARCTCRRWRNTSSVGDMLDELEWPSLETRREQSSLIFFYKIHSGTVSLDKDKYLTPAPNLRRTRASHESQCTRYLAYRDALKILFPQDYPYVE